MVTGKSVPGSEGVKKGWTPLFWHHLQYCSHGHTDAAFPSQANMLLFKSVGITFRGVCSSEVLGSGSPWGQTLTSGLPKRFQTLLFNLFWRAGSDRCKYCDVVWSRNRHCFLSTEIYSLSFIFISGSLDMFCNGKGEDWLFLVWFWN